MANRTLYFEAGNGNWWGPRSHERKLLIGPKHTLHWIHWRISCSCVGKYGWKTVESRCNLVCFSDSVLCRELVVYLKKSLLTAGQSGECTSFIVRSSVWRKFWLTHSTSTGWSSVMMKVIKWDHESVKIHSGSQPDVDKDWRRADTV